MMGCFYAFVVSNAVLYGVAVYDVVSTTFRCTAHLWCPFVSVHYVFTSLPAVQRIHYKIAMTTFNSIRSTCAAYFRDVSRQAASANARATLRSADHSDLIEHRNNTKRYGRRSFRISAATVWNKLPSHLLTEDISREQFARVLKSEDLSADTCLLVGGASVNLCSRGVDKWTY